MTMTWEELKEKAKGLGYYCHRTIEIHSQEPFEWIEKDGLLFRNDGEVFFREFHLAWYRTPEQMLKIMEALQ